MSAKKRDILVLIPKLTHDRLLDLLEYDSNSGVFTWKTAYTTRVKPGMKAGEAKPRSRHYRSDGIVNIDGAKYRYAHLAFFYVTGVWPAEEIDHIDHNPWNNAFSNLREATRAENCRHMRLLSKSNKHGFKGVYSVSPNRKGQRRFGAKITVGGRRKNLGYFHTPEDAYEAYKVASVKYHGEFGSYV